MATQTILDKNTCFRRQLDTGKLVPCVRECRNFISNMSSLVCSVTQQIFEILAPCQWGSYPDCQVYKLIAISSVSLSNI